MPVSVVHWLKWIALLLSLSILAAYVYFEFGPGRVVKATFEPGADGFYMRGVITSATPRDLAEAMEEFPGLSRIVMVDVPGSIDDAANLEAAAMVRAARMTTELPADGVIASGGTDFFLAGTDRVIQIGGCVGVHAWSRGMFSAPARDLPRDHPSHAPYLAYYASIGIDPAFYWYTLSAAPPSSVHWMTSAEMRTYSVATMYETAQISSIRPCEDRP